jgi:Arc/MetJ family transcription regulator
MRTTLEIDDDLLAAARELADHGKTTMGRVVSDLIRQALTRPTDAPLAQRNGFSVLPKRGGVVTTELVTRLADDERGSP